MQRFNGCSRGMSAVMGSAHTRRTRTVNRRSQSVSPVALWPSARLSVVMVVLLLITTLGLTPQAHAQVGPGDILVIDEFAGTHNRGALFIVHPSNGHRTIVSDFGNSTQGTLGAGPFGLALEASGNILVIDDLAEALFRVNPATGHRTVLSDFDNPDQGPLGRAPVGVALEESGNILVIDDFAGTDNKGTLFRVNPATGSRTVVSDFGDANQGPLGNTPGSVAPVPPQPRLGDILVIDLEAGANPISAGNTGGALFIVNPLNGSRALISNFGMSAQGPLGFNPFGVAVEASGNILVIDSGVGLASGALFRVSPATGNRTVVSDFGKSTQGPLGGDPMGVAVEASGHILVIDSNAGTGSSGALFRVHPTTGKRTVVSDFGQSAQGPLGGDPIGVAVETSGNILVTDEDAGTGNAGALFRVNPATGHRTLLSDFGNSAQGPLGSDPIGVAVEASGSILVIDFNAGTNNKGALFRVNSSNGRRTVLSDFGNSAQGATLGVNPWGVALGASGKILVIDFDAGTNNKGALFSVHPTSGNRTVLSDFGASSQGILGAFPLGVIAYTVKCGGLNATIIGNSFDNTIIGTSGRDIIHGMGGNDTINGLGGDDVICGGTGDDTLNGGSSNDRLLGQAGHDTLNGSTGTDTCDGGTQNDTATGCETQVNVP